MIMMCITMEPHDYKELPSELFEDLPSDDNPRIKNPVVMQMSTCWQKKK
jgi:hypothetical protein